MDAKVNKIYKFGEFRLDIADKTLWREKSKIPLTLKAIELLILLVENQGRTVTKTEILEKFWHNTYVEENILAVLVSSLRKALNEKKDNARFIETVPRRGYRFIHELEEVEIDEIIEKPEIAGFVSKTRRNSDIQKHIRLQTIILAALGMFAVGVISVWFYSNWFRSSANQTQTLTFKANYGTPSTLSAVKTLLILPVKQVNTNGRGFDTEFAQNLILRIGSLGKFNVRPLYTVMSESTRFALGKKNLAEKADFVLEGKVELLEGNKFRVAVNLLDVKNDSIIWSDDLSETDVVKLQESISEQTVNQILRVLTPEERAQAEKHRPTTIPAYAAYLKGLEKLRNRTDCIAFFLEAIELDPNFAPAYTMLAEARAFGGWKNSPQAIEAKNYLEKSLFLDDSQADAYAVQGFMQIFHQFDWEGAEKSLRRALELDSRNVNAHHWLACWLTIHRRLDEAKAEMEKALEFDPVSPTLIADLGQIYYFANDYEKATELANQAILIEPNQYFAKGYLQRIKEKNKFDREVVFQDLERRANGVNFGLAYINVDPFYDPIREEPRFQEILRKVNLAN